MADESSSPSLQFVEALLRKGPDPEVPGFPDPVGNWTREMLQHYAGLDLTDDHGKETPKRFLSMLDELTSCKSAGNEHIEQCIKWKVFESDADQMIIVERIPFHSVCNHHVIPFIGEAHIAYVPTGEVAGLSKFARVVRHFARQLQVQERMTQQIHKFLDLNLNTKGIGVIVRAEHMCMTLRGIQVPGTYTTTAQMSGVFGDHDRTAKMEFLSYVNGRGHG